jgi:hypothetical protein
MALPEQFHSCGIWTCVRSRFDPLPDTVRCKEYCRNTWPLILGSIGELGNKIRFSLLEQHNQLVLIACVCSAAFDATVLLPFNFLDLFSVPRLFVKELSSSSCI